MSQTFSFVSLKTLRLYGRFARRTVRRWWDDMAHLDNDPTTLDAATRTIRRAGWGVGGVFLGGGLLWAALTPLDAAAVATGTVMVESNRKTIQHLEGGIINSIHVHEGDKVIAGQLLVSLDDIAARAQMDGLQGQYDAALALKARLRAERDGGAIVWPEDLLARQGSGDVAALMRTQTDVLNSRRQWVADKQDLHRQSKAGEEKKIDRTQAQIAAKRDELTLLNEQIEEQAQAVKDGVIARSKHLALKRKAASVAAEIAQNETRLEETRKALAEVSSQARLPAAENLNTVMGELQDVEIRLATLKEKLLNGRDILARTQVRAPQAGIVQDVQVHTAGGVVQPGQRLMDLVPLGDKLVVDARVDPKDMAAVYKGMPARVMITAFNPRTTPALEGRVSAVSADRLVDPATGEVYFAARITPTGNALDTDKLMPGMTAQVFLVKQARTVLDYALEPLLRGVAAAGREG